MNSKNAVAHEGSFVERKLFLRSPSGISDTRLGAEADFWNSTIEGERGSFVNLRDPQPPKEKFQLKRLAMRIVFLALMTQSGAGVLGAADTGPELTLSQFWTLVQSQRSGQSPAVSRPGAEEVFSQLLAAQGREAAARQSLDRLSGWSKAAQTRLAAQSAPPLDVEVLRFAEGKAAARVAQFEAAGRRVLRQANRLLGREPDSPLVALLTPTGPTTEPNQTEQPADSSSQPNDRQKNPTPGKTADSARLRAQFEKELLPQAHDLLSKMYQSYLFGGTPLSALLWEEQEVYSTELRYRLLLGAIEMELSATE